ncbi:MAG: DNA polymerase III subunit gamma/tau [Pirellulaceae bacterium]
MADSNPTPPEYLVVARRYRPQSFGELVGQQRVAQALANAIQRNRVGHAYLFTGARGVGKTSSARIFAKALNCVHGPTPTPCNECEICLGVTAGEDVDVLEIDGASNRGIEEIRQLRSNINVRPSRARFKVYIIDEVHMFTKEAFNALLKTLEEPPDHAKFIFCTTDPEKIPITVLSRCQRFDFGGIQPEDIEGRLSHIVAQENVSASPDALRLIARRANGSMRDSQSLLEQILAFGDTEITIDSVHRLLGTADIQQIVDMVSAIIHAEAAKALELANAAIHEGVDPGQLLEQLLRYFRDLMTLAVGADDQLLQLIPPAEANAAGELARGIGLAKILACIQCLDESLVRMQRSTYGHVLAEATIVRLCGLEDLDRLSELAARLASGGGISGSPTRQPAASRAQGAGGGRPAEVGGAVAESQKKTAELIAPPTTEPSIAREPPSPPISESILPESGSQKPNLPSHPEPSASPTTDTSASRDVASDTTGPTVQAITAENLPKVWDAALSELTGIVGDTARKATRVAISGPNRLVVEFSSSYNFGVEYLSRPQNQVQLEKALREQCGSDIRLVFKLAEGGPSAPPTMAASKEAVQREGLRLRQHAEQNPWVQQAMEIFGAEVTSVRPPEQK